MSHRSLNSKLIMAFLWLFIKWKIKKETFLLGVILLTREAAAPFAQRPCQMNYPEDKTRKVWSTVQQACLKNLCCLSFGHLTCTSEAGNYPEVIASFRFHVILPIRYLGTWTCVVWTSFKFKNWENPLLIDFWPTYVCIVPLSFWIVLGCCFLLSISIHIIFWFNLTHQYFKMKQIQSLSNTFLKNVYIDPWFEISNRTFYFSCCVLQKLHYLRQFLKTASDTIFRVKWM